MPLTRRELTVALLGGAATSVLAACAAPATVPTDTNPLVKPRAAGVPLTAVQASTELALGRNRFAIGLIDDHNQPVNDGMVNIEFFKLQDNGQGQKRAESPAVFRSVGGTSRGMWVAPASFSETGAWGARVTRDPGDGGAPKTAQMTFSVIDKFSAPGYDEPAPRSASPTDSDVGGDTSHICSNSPPCDLHTISIADALQPADRPLVVVFATPAFCTSATCAPQLQAIQQLHTAYADRANFIHVEIYQYPFEALQPAPTVDEWRLPSDPWTFIVDQTGIVRDRFEGAAPYEELEPSLKTVLPA